MSKKKQKSRRRRAFSPAQLAAQKRFTEMVKSGKFKKGKKKKARKNAAKKKRAAKKAARKVAHKAVVKHAKRRHKRAKHRANPHAKKHARKHARKHAKRRHNPFHALMRKNAAKKRGLSPKQEQEMGEALAQEAYQAEQMQAGVTGEKMPQSRFRRGARLAAMSPVERRAYMRRAQARKKNKVKIEKVRSQLAKVRTAMSKAPSRSRKRILRARRAALNLHRSWLTGQISGADRRVLEASNLMQVRNNPGFGEIFASLKTLAPQLGAHAVGLAGVAYVGQMAGDKLAANIPSWMPGKELVAKHAVSISTVGVALAAYEALKHASPKTRPFAGAVLMGGVAAAFVHAAARMQTKSGASNLGKDIGLPLGPMVVAVPPAAAAAQMQAAAAPVKGFVDIEGRALAVDGLGEYMALSGSTLTGSSLGEYMALSGSTLTGSSLGDFTSIGEIGQMSEGRQGARALNAPGDVPVEDFLSDEEEEDEGSLSGSIFDD